MRLFSRLVAVVFLAVGAALLVGGATAADPPPIVKPVVNAGGGTRVRLKMLGDTPTSSFKAFIPKPKGKAGDQHEITLYVGTMTGPPYVSTQQWKAWGFEVPKNLTDALPELVIPAAQLLPKPAKGRDAELRLTRIPVTLYEAPGGEKGGVTNALGLPLSALTNNADRAVEPRVHFADRFIELTAPISVPGKGQPVAAKSLGTGNEKLADLQLTTDDKLLAAYLPLNVYGLRFVSVNGHTQYERPNKKVEVAGGLSIGDGAPIVMSVNMARGCGVQLDKEAGPTKGKVKELRFGPLLGPGIKGQKDFVLKDVTVTISNDESGSYIYLSSAFAEEYFKDGVYTCDPLDGVWKLHGRVKPEYTDDQKNRGKKP